MSEALDALQKTVTAACALIERLGAENKRLRAENERLRAERQAFKDENKYE